VRLVQQPISVLPAFFLYTTNNLVFCLGRVNLIVHLNQLIHFFPCPPFLRYGRSTIEIYIIYISPPPLNVVVSPHKMCLSKLFVDPPLLSCDLPYIFPVFSPDGFHPRLFFCFSVFPPRGINLRGTLIFLIGPFVAFAPTRGPCPLNFPLEGPQIYTSKVETPRQSNQVPAISPTPVQGPNAVIFPANSPIG